MTSKKIFSAFFIAFVFSANAQLLTQEDQFTTSGGLNSGSVLSGIGANTFYGFEAGQFVTPDGYSNTFMGHQAGVLTSRSNSNVFVGAMAGQTNVKGSFNIFVGTFAGRLNNSDHGSNVMIGHGAGVNNTSGCCNTFLGHTAGQNSTGAGNVFIGGNAGANEALRSDQLYIANTDTHTPLIYGDFRKNKIGIGGFSTFPILNNVNINAYTLFVKGGILTEEVRVRDDGTWLWADYVFTPDYKLPSLSEVEKYIAENGHLENVPSAQTVKENGIELSEMARIQMEKIEELTLYLIQQNKEIETLKAQVSVLLAKK